MVDESLLVAWIMKEVPELQVQAMATIRTTAGKRNLGSKMSLEERRKVDGLPCEDYVGPTPVEAINGESGVLNMFDSMTLQIAVSRSYQDSNLTISCIKCRATAVERVCVFSATFTQSTLMKSGARHCLRFRFYC